MIFPLLEIHTRTIWGAGGPQMKNRDAAISGLRRPSTPPLPLKRGTFGTSRWQLCDETTLFTCVREGGDVSSWPIPVATAPGRRVRLRG
jgi:hypothetical protein